MSFHVPEKFRITDQELGNNGRFMVRLYSGKTFQVIASDGLGWEHVSVSRPSRAPAWAEMCEIKDLFWDAEDCVVQYHPPRSEYCNCHPYCLHMWRMIGIDFPRPPAGLVGPVGGPLIGSRR